MTRTITAMFSARAAADRAVNELTRELGIGSGQVQVYAAEAAPNGATTAGAATGDTGLWASLKDLFVPDEDRTAYAEGIRRGNYVVSAQVDETMLDRAMDILEHNGAVDLDAQEAEWRQSGWTGHQAGATTGATVGTSPSNPQLGVVATGAAVTGAAAAPVTGQTSVATTPSRTGAEEVIPIVEERIQVGKRDVERGRVRVRSYIVETPVSEQVTLREEHVDVQRRAVDRPLTDADEAFRERVIDATEHSEQAVVGKEARVKEELVIRKDVAERTETVQDSVRRTEVEVDDTRGTTGTSASRAVDKTLGTNISGANPNKR
ncbi:DUF2382 domain-containing protein [Roseomonas nepalensis]|uniref:DUF2382 domain-containing protein n=1 Tax=Muricoccus nepalensis TaxID=1854500 RepID=A0A502FJ99_9PROT|nr:YsnF/AvaK domain-containing protein [Roseomonas nepalensis]TPG49322.1 DUF2382 domain-containing protein [Roseomonas nepalensis]